MTTLNKDKVPVSRTLPPAIATETEALQATSKRHLKRVRRLKINVAAWVLGTSLVTALWALNEWHEKGALERFGHEGDPGQWNPTLWAVFVGLWSLIVGITALRVRIERPVTMVDVDRELRRFERHTPPSGAGPDAESRRFARRRLERVRRLKFHAAAWLLGMIVLSQLWALIEWQDNGRFERFSNDSQPGEWEPWIVYIAGVWALVVAIFALRVYVDRPAPEADTDA